MMILSMKSNSLKSWNDNVSTNKNEKQDNKYRLRRLPCQVCIIQPKNKNRLKVLKVIFGTRVNFAFIDLEFLQPASIWTVVNALSILCSATAWSAQNVWNKWGLCFLCNIVTWTIMFVRYLLHSLSLLSAHTLQE